MGFEPTESCPSAAFKAAALVHYAISPYGIIRGAHPKALRVERDTEPHHIPMRPPTTPCRGSRQPRPHGASSTTLVILLADTARALSREARGDGVVRQEVPATLSRRRPGTYTRRHL